MMILPSGVIDVVSSDHVMIILTVACTTCSACFGDGIGEAVSGSAGVADGAGADGVLGGTGCVDGSVDGAGVGAGVSGAEVLGTVGTGLGGGVSAWAVPTVKNVAAARTNMMNRTLSRRRFGACLGTCRCGMDDIFCLPCGFD
jgi:hypothetical protein